MRCVLPLLLIGCAAEPAPLLDGARWSQADADAGPFAAHGEGAPDCRAAGWGPELGGLEVDTGECPYASLQQRTLVRARAGDRLVVEWWHQRLASVEPSEGHLALTVDDHVLWERVVPIPSDAATYLDDIELPVDIPLDTPVLLHLHNHGTNTWNLFRVERHPQ